MNDNILDVICAELVRTMGPVAPVIIRDKLESIGTDTKNMPLEKIVELVEKISYEINDEKSRAEFQRKALEELKHSSTHAGS